MRGYLDFDSAQSDNAGRQKQNDLTPLFVTLSEVEGHG